VPNTCKSYVLVSQGTREWRTGEEHVDHLPHGEEYHRETGDNTAYAWPARGKQSSSARGSAERWVRARLARWWGNGLPRLRSVAGLRGRSATLGLRTAQTPTGGSSEEFSSMVARLNEQRRVQEDGLRVVNCFFWRRARTVSRESAPANYVPAAAVIRRGQALSGVTGRKAHAGGQPSFR
jgi:hypothetical protein